MAGKYVCPHCGSDKIKKEYPDDDEYCCSSCLEFFTTPKEVTSGEKPEKEINENKGEKKTMPTGKLDFDKIKKLAAANKTIPEIIKETGYNPASVRSAIIRLGLKCKDARGGINAKPAIPSPSSILGIDASNKEKSPSRKIGTCRNCKRERWIQGNGLDTGCFNRVKDLTPGTPEYTSALAKAKEDFNNPEYRSDRGWQNRRGKNPDKKKAEKKNQYNWHVKESHEQGTMSESSDKFKRRFKKSVTPADSMFKIREAENINIISLSVLIAERNMHQACVFKLNKAIEALQ